MFKLIPSLCKEYSNLINCCIYIYYLQLAIVHTEDFPSNKFSGSGMVFNAYNPRVEGQQHSACRLKMIKETNVVQIGWRVSSNFFSTYLCK